MSNYTLSALVERIRNKLKDKEYPKSDIIDDLNDAQFEILGEDKYQFSESIDRSNMRGSGELPVPKDYQTTIRMFADDKDSRRELQYLAPNEFFNTPRKPFTYSVYATTVYVELPKDSNGCDARCKAKYKITHHYLAKPTEMEKDSDVPSLPYEYGEALLLGALARSEQARGNYDVARVYEDKQANLLVNLRLRYGPRQVSAQNRTKLPFRSF